MADLNTFIEAIASDVDSVVVPRIEGLAHDVGAKAQSDYVPRVSAFAHQLVQDIVAEQSAVVRDFASTLVIDLFRRYRPEFSGQLRARVVEGGIEVSGEAITLELKRRGDGTSVSTLDIPVSMTIKVEPLAVSVQDTTIRLDVVR